MVSSEADKWSWKPLNSGMENPYMFIGQVERVRIRVDADQFTQIVDWFSDNFRVVGFDADEDSYYDIEVRVNLNSFTFWVLQYSGCVEVLETRLYSVLERMFPDGEETYTFEEVKRLFEEEGVYPKNFEAALSTCIEEGWIIDCGNGNYTR
jgi:hypothetical protein